MFTRTPKKPNSAIRKLSKEKLTNKRIVGAYIPGVGHTLRQFSATFIRNGRVQDLPEVKYKCIWGKLDFFGIIIEKQQLNFWNKKRKKSEGVRNPKKKLIGSPLKYRDINLKWAFEVFLINKAFVFVHSVFKYVCSSKYFVYRL